MAADLLCVSHGACVVAIVVVALIISLVVVYFLCNWYECGLLYNSLFGCVWY